MTELVDLLLFTVNEHETNAVMEGFYAQTQRIAKSLQIENRTYRDLGTINGARVVHTLSQMGSGSPGGAQQTVSKAIAALKPKAIIGIGIAFGIDEKRQKLGDILISKQLCLYEFQKKGANSNLTRGDGPRASTKLIDYFEGIAQTSWSDDARVKFGLMLTGEKLVDNVDFRNELLQIEPEAIGGEMEGAGLYVAALEEKVDWIVIKAICDWAANKSSGDKEALQKTAAENAVRFLLHALNEVPLPSGPINAVGASNLATTSSAPAVSESHQEPNTVPATKENSNSRQLSINNVPTHCCNNFVERPNLLDQIEHALCDKFAPTVVSGLWGLGKTELARKFANETKLNYRIKWWIRSDSEITRLMDYSALADRLGLTSNSPFEAIDLVTKELAKQTDWLIVFDNLPDAESLYIEQKNSRISLIPLITKQNQHVLITSQNSRWVGPSVISSLKMDPEDSLKILRSAAPTTSIEESNDLNKILDGHALALQQAASYIANTKIGVPTYIDRLQKHQSEVFKARFGQLVDNPHITAVTVFDLCLTQVRSANILHGDNELIGTACIALLCLCAYLDPESIDVEFIRSNTNYLMEPLASSVTQDLTFDSLIALLNSYSLINRQSTNGFDTISIHRFIQFLIKDVERDCKLWAPVALKILSSNFSYEKAPVSCQRLLGHAIAITNYYSEEASVNELSKEQLLELTQLLERLGEFLRFAGQYREARPLVERALTLANKQDNRMLICSISSLLSSLYLDLGDIESAAPQLNSAYEFVVNTFGENHPNVGAVLSDLARFNQMQGNFAEAEKFLEKSMKLYQRFPGELNLNIATILNNLAAICCEKGDSKSAEHPLRLALLITEQHLGAENLSTLKVRLNLASACHTNGNYNEAKELNEATLKRLEDILSPDHPIIAQCISNLAATYFEECDFLQTELLAERALTIKEKALGTEHIDLVQTLSILGPAYTHQEKYDLAEPVLKRALRIALAAFGTNHPLTATSFNNLGKYYEEIADYVNAENCLLNSLIARLNFFTASHRELNGTYINLLRVYANSANSGTTFNVDYVVAKLIDIQNRLLGDANESIRIQLLREYFRSNSQPNFVRTVLTIGQTGRLIDQTLIASSPEVYEFALQAVGSEGPENLRSFLQSDIIKKPYIATLPKNTKVMLVETTSAQIGKFKILAGLNEGKHFFFKLASVRL